MYILHAPDHYLNMKLYFLENEFYREEDSSHFVLLNLYRGAESALTVTNSM